VNAVAKFVKRAVGTETSADIGRSIEAMRAEGTAARDEAAMHEAAALTASTFEEAESLRRKAAEARWRSDRAEARLLELEERLSAAKAREQAAALERHRTRRVALYRKLRAALEAAAAAQVETIKADEQARLELGENVAMRHLPPFVFRGLILPDLVEIWAAETERLVMAPVRPSPTPAAPVRPAGARKSRQLPHERERLPTTSDVHRPATTALVGPSPTFAARAPDDTAPLEPGQVRARVARSGYSPSDTAPQCARGQIIRIAKATAERAAAAGVLEIIEGDPKTGA
jgi:hypothetical protein